MHRSTQRGRGSRRKDGGVMHQDHGMACGHNSDCEGAEGRGRGRRACHIPSRSHPHRGHIPYRSHPLSVKSSTAVTSPTRSHPYWSHPHRGHIPPRSHPHRGHIPPRSHPTEVTSPIAVTSPPQSHPPPRSGTPRVRLRWQGRGGGGGVVQVCSSLVQVWLRFGSGLFGSGLVQVWFRFG